MGFRYRKSIKLAPGVRMTFSRSGVSYSAGSKSMRVTKRADGRVTTSAHVPGTGVGYTSTTTHGRSGSRSRSSRQPIRSATPVHTSAAPKPGLFAPHAEKNLYKAVKAQDWSAIEQVGRDDHDYAVLTAAMAGIHLAALGEKDRARELLQWSFTSGQDPAAQAFSRKYLHTVFTLTIAEGVHVELPVNREAVGLALASLFDERGELEAGIDVLEQLEPTTIAALALAELYEEAGRHEETVSLTEGVTNEDDATALLCAFRGAAFREQGYYDAAREAFKEALRIRKRDPRVRHRALVERARTYLAQNQRALARKDLEKVLAEDSNYDGLAELLGETAPHTH